MNIDKMIQDLLKEESPKTAYTNPPLWAKEILQELKEIKTLLKQNSYKKTKSHPQSYYNFVNSLRKRLKIDAKDNKHPRIFYKNSYYGISEDGLLYNMHTLNNLPTSKAFEIFEFLYKNRDSLEKYIFVNSTKRKS